jgi:hypothetical protein
MTALGEQELLGFLDFLARQFGRLLTRQDVRVSISRQCDSATVSGHGALGPKRAHRAQMVIRPAQASESRSAHAIVRRSESEYPEQSVAPPFGWQTCQHFSIPRAGVQAGVLSRLPLHGRPGPVGQHHSGQGEFREPWRIGADCTTRQSHALREPERFGEAADCTL